MTLLRWTCCFSLLFVSNLWAAEPEPATIINPALEAVGGRDKLLKLFRLKERLNVSPDPSKPGNERVSVCEPPGHWWLGKNDRVVKDKEPATFLVWAWTLGPLVDPQSKLETLPEIVDAERPAAGLRISGTINPPMDCYFDNETHLLVRIDWRTDTVRFSEWKEHDGAKYASKVVGTKKATGKPWYFTEILEVERLSDIPAGLVR